MTEKKKIEKEYEKKVNKLWDIVTMAYDAIGFINEHGGEKEESAYGLQKLCEDIQKAKAVDSPAKQDIEAMNDAIHGARATLKEILDENRDAEKYLKENWPQANEILPAKKETAF